MYSPAWPHSEIKEVLPNIFYVMGTNIKTHENVEYQHSRNMIIVRKEGGILVTCDSIKNWVSTDPYFSADSAKLYQAQGFFGTGTISSVWKHACKVQSSDFVRLKSLKFKHLLSAHGEPLLDNADEAITQTIQKEYEV